jgi:hypothetical protein
LTRTQSKYFDSSFIASQYVRSPHAAQDEP